MSLTVGLGGVRRHACVAVADERRLLGVCEQERVTRVRGAGVNATGLPDEALDLVLSRANRTHPEIARYIVAESGEPAPNALFASVDHHYAHACAAYLTSPFDAATIVVCDHEAPKVSVWRASDGRVDQVAWPWSGPGFSDVYSASARALGFRSEAADQHFEVLARYAPAEPDPQVQQLLSTDAHSLIVGPNWQSAVEQPRAAFTKDVARQAKVAAALESRIGGLFLELLGAVKAESDSDHLCLGGSFFYHSSINSIAKRSGVFPARIHPHRSRECGPGRRLCSSGDRCSSAAAVAVPWSLVQPG